MEHQMTNYQAGGQDLSAREQLEWSVGFVFVFFSLETVPCYPLPKGL